MPARHKAANILPSSYWDKFIQIVCGYRQAFEFDLGILNGTSANHKKEKVKKSTFT